MPAPQAATPNDKRALVCKLLTDPFPPTNARIAVIAEVSERTVIRLKQQLQNLGVEYVPDGRARSGRRTVFDKAWTRIEELKKQNPRYGGRELWAYLVGEGEFREDELPSVGRIDGWLSERKLTVKVARTGKTDKLPYLQEPVTAPLDRVGMDGVYPFLTRSGAQKLQCVDVRDWYSGAVYIEPFPYFNPQQAYMVGLDQRAFAGVFLRFVDHIGLPKVLVLDNGLGQIIDRGHLPQIARFALELGVTVEWEPYGRPWKSGAVERWHRDLQKWYADRKSEATTIQKAAAMLKGRANFVNHHWPRRQFNNQPAARHMTIKPIKTDEPALYPEAMGMGELSRPGIVRMQRTVETGGLVQLHGNEYFRVSDLLVGGYVRISFQVQPRAQLGIGTVEDGKGNVVATFQHHVDAPRPDGWNCLVNNVKLIQFHGEGDCRGNWSQSMHDEQVRRIMKRDRAKGITRANEEWEGQP